ncbi:hypothetical protein [Nitrospina watsonii]|uniref:hypothetical protein n=1 Tax=Nitrospina watsonii TaxID=1323948 RepID=UPI00248FE85B|nr:hypothetical protein [Nitrospina watsonii]
MAVSLIPEGSNTGRFYTNCGAIDNLLGAGWSPVASRSGIPVPIQGIWRRGMDFPLELVFNERRFVSA